MATFGLFLLPQGRPRRFFPMAEEPTVAEEEESMVHFSAGE
jgi:hypothetical protein